MESKTLRGKVLYFLCYMSPKKVDRMSIVVVGVAADGSRYVLDCWAKRSTPKQVIQAIIDMHNKYECKKIGFEAVALQTIYKQYIIEKA